MSEQPFENISSIRNTGPANDMNLGDVELNQNIKLGEEPVPEQRFHDTNFTTDGDLNTLDEPVSETIKRDLHRIYSKLKIVVNPFQLGVINSDDNIEEKRKEVRNWDLWGPFIFCLILSV